MMPADRIHGGAVLAAVLALSAPAAAQDRPVFPPTRDVAVTYQTNIANAGAPHEVVMRVSVAQGRARVDGGLPGYVLVDLKSRRATIVMEQMGVMMDAPPHAGLDQAFVLENGKRFARLGSDTVAGLRCRVWEVTGDDASGTVCVTADGVVLRASGHDRKGRTGTLEATRVQYGQQADALFVPPPNVHKVTIAPGPGVAAVLNGLRPRQP
jgi:hypothetical protein